MISFFQNEFGAHKKEKNLSTHILDMKIIVIRNQRIHLNYYS